MSLEFKTSNNTDKFIIKEGPIECPKCGQETFYRILGGLGSHRCSCCEYFEVISPDTKLEIKKDEVMTNIKYTEIESHVGVGTSDPSALLTVSVDGVTLEFNENGVLRLDDLFLACDPSIPLLAKQIIKAIKQ